MNLKGRDKNDKPNERENLKIYRRLQQVFDLHPMGAPESEVFLEILRELFSPEEARLASTMSFVLTEASEIADQAGLPVDEANEWLEAMADKGAILATKKGGRPRYALVPAMPGFFEFSLVKGERTPKTEKMGRLWDEYFRRSFGKQMHHSGVSLCRVIPTEREIPSDVEVMDFESSTRLIENARSVALGKCQCRFASANCDAPLDVCILLDTWAEFLTDRGLARTISTEEALDALRRAEAAGLVHTLNNATKSPFICNCCPCCCFMLRGLTEFRYTETLARSRFVASIHEDRCTGCRLCEPRCHFDALRLEGDLMKIEEDRCYGCGLCVSVCEEGAITLVVRKGYQEPYSNSQSLVDAIAQAKGKPVLTRKKAP